MAGLFNNLSTYLQSVDNLLGEQLGEQEQSATEIRSQRRNRLEADDSSKATDDASQTSDVDVTPGSTGSASIAPGSAPSVDSPEPPPASQVSVTRPTAAHGALSEKDKEIESLNQELLELEDRCKSLQAEIVDTWKTYKTAQEKAALREGELHDEINTIKRAKETDKQQYLVGVEALQEEVESLKGQLRAMSQEEDLFHSKIATLQQELGSVHQEADELRGDLHQTREAEELSVLGVRDELRQAKQQVEELRTQHAVWQRNAQKREWELEKLNAELVDSLTQKNRELEAMTSTSHEDQALALANTRGDELRREISQLQTQLSGESQAKQALTRQLLVVDGELTRLKTSQEAELKAMLETNRDLTAKLDAQKQQLQELESTNGESAYKQAIAEMQQKLQASTAQLLRKQTALTELQTEHSALRATIQDLKRRNQRLEQQLDHTRDMEDDAPYMRDSKDKVIRRRVPSRRNDGIGKALEPMGVNQKVVKIGLRSLRQAVETVDSWSLLAGAFLRANPFARFGFLLYLIVLHLWVFVVLSLKTSALQDSMTDTPVDSTNINPA